MKSEYRGILAIVLSAGFFLLWFTVINPPQKKAPEPDKQIENASQRTEPQKSDLESGTKNQPQTTEESKKVAGKVLDPQGNIPVKTCTLSNGLIETTLINEGAAVTAWKILSFGETTEKNSPLMELAAGKDSSILALSNYFESSNLYIPDKPRYELVEQTPVSAVFRWRSSELEIKKTILLKKDEYLADVTIEIINLTKNPWTANPAIVWSRQSLPKKEGGLLGFIKNSSADNIAPVYFIDNGVKREAGESKENTKTVKNGNVLWAGVESRYFLSAIIPRIQGEGLSLEYGSDSFSGKDKDRVIWAGVVWPQLTATPADKAVGRFSIYSGPKEMDKLKAVGVKLEEAIDFGWFAIIAIPILYLLKFFYGLINNYGVAIILLTIFVKLLCHPINVKSLKSMKAMQQLQPRLKELQQKYKNDKQRLNQETMSLFKAHKVNPMGGCLPMLLQFPIYIALYKVLWNSIELYHAPFFWFYRDLSAPDPYFITPILLGIFMVAQQKVMPSTSADPAQQKMMMLMPIMFSVFMLFLPAGLVIYILVNTVMSVTQQYMYNHGMLLRDVVRGKIKWKE